MRGWRMVFLAGCLVVGGCADSDSAEPGGSAASPIKLDQSIRQFDFGNTTWVVEHPDVQVHLTDGNGTRQYEDLTIFYQLFGEPAYADVDGDGDEDAAVGITDNGGGNGANSIWYVWLWQDGTAKQLSAQPFAFHTRCSGRVDAVQPVPEGFEVLDAIWDGSTSCAAGKAKPFSYVISVRDGFLVQVKPRLAPLEMCHPARQTRRGPAPPGLVGYLAPDERAPRLAPREYREVRFSESAGPEEEWTLVLLSTDDEDFCGWVRTSEIIG